MGRDRSLDEFLEAGEGADGAESGGGDAAPDESEPAEASASAATTAPSPADAGSDSGAERPDANGDADGDPEEGASEGRPGMSGVAESTDEEGTDGSATDLEVHPAEPTMAWAADANCEACGGAAERRWRDGDRMVCDACKEW